MIRLFLGIDWVANTPHPWILDRRFSIIGHSHSGLPRPRILRYHPRMRTQPLLRVAFLFAATAMISAQTPKRIVNVGPSLGLPFSSAVVAGGLVYVSGSIALDSSGKTSGDIRAQTKQTLDGLAKTLDAAGSSMPMVASVMVYLRNAADFPAM